MKKQAIVALLGVLFFFPAFSSGGEVIFKKNLPKTRVGSQERSFLQVTVYNNLALVQDTRRVKLLPGEGILNFGDVAAYLKPESVRVKSTNQPGDFTLLEQNYLYDFLAPRTLLERYVGKKIKIVDFNHFQDRKETAEAVLLSAQGQGVYKIGEEIYLGHPGYKVLPELPEEPAAEPTLNWLYKNTAADMHLIELTYLTQNMGWRADYNAVFSEEESSLDLFAWATIDNKSGARFEKASLRLVAGQPQQEGLSRPQLERDHGERMAVASAPLSEGVTQSDFFEYHLYKLERMTTLEDKQMKQVSLLEAKGIKAESQYIVESAGRFYAARSGQGKRSRPVWRYLKFKNSRENGAGTPLAAGAVRVYGRDERGNLQFLGASALEHIPEDEEVVLKVGEAFDLRAERTQTDYVRLATRLHETEWEVVLKNHKEKQVEITVREVLSGNWEIVRNSHYYKKVDANRVEFAVKVPAGGETKISYRVKVGL